MGNRLPEKFVKQGLEMANGSTLFGVPFAEMTRDDLIAAAAQGWMAVEKAREQERQSLMTLFPSKVGPISA